MLLRKRGAMTRLSRTAVVHACSNRGLELHLEGMPACAACARAAGCQRVADRVPIFVATGVAARPGNRLTLRIGVADLMAAALRGYVLPSLLLLSGAGLGKALTPNSGDLGPVLGACIGLALCGVLLRLYDARHGIRLWQVEPEQPDAGAEMR